MFNGIKLSSIGRKLENKTKKDDWLNDRHRVILHYMYHIDNNTESYDLHA